MDTVKVVIGSWGSYNECNERSLGSKWLDLSDYEDWEEIESELKKQGFKLDGIDEELFIQDVEGIEDNSISWDNMHPKELFETLKESGVLDDDYKYEEMTAYLEIRCWSDFKELVDKYGSNWDSDIHYYRGYDWEDYGREMFECYGYKIPEVIENFIDFEAYGKYIGDCCAEECSGGYFTEELANLSPRRYMAGWSFEQLLKYAKEELSWTSIGIDSITSFDIYSDKERWCQNVIKK